MRPRVNTRKHYIQSSIDTTASGALKELVLVDAVAVPDVSANSEVVEGAIISAVYLEMWITTDDAAVNGSAIVVLEKLPGTGTKIAAGQIAALDVYVNKKNIFYTQMGLTPKLGTYPMAVVRGWFKIPKSKQRFGLRDQLRLTIFAQSDGITTCGFATFKEQF